MSRRAFTMIEMLVALAATLLMMGATVTLFGVIVDSVSGSRALLEISDKLRATRNRIQADLQGATATMKPPRRPENDEGYLELIEGANFDGNPNAVPPPPGQPQLNSLFGDTDDVLLLTVRSRGEPFVGKATAPGPGTVESQVAEIAYFLVQDGPIIDATATPAPLRLFTLYRRCMLVHQPTTWTLPATAGLPFYLDYDVSSRYETPPPPALPARIANTLGDLTKPENRFNRVVGGIYPQRWAASMVPFAGTRLGDDILMTNVLAFDVQVYDPGAPVFPLANNNTSPVIAAVEPRDAIYPTTINSWVASSYANSFGASPYVVPPPPVNPPSSLIAFGAYADLGYGEAALYSPPNNWPSPMFARAPDPRSGIPATRTPTNPYVYDTWSLHYENDGVDQFTDGTIDLSTNGLDDALANGIVDDIAERETLPPYPAQLRGVRIVIRVYEQSSLQVRQVTIVQDFLPE